MALEPAAPCAELAKDIPDTKLADPGPERKVAKPLHVDEPAPSTFGETHGPGEVPPCRPDVLNGLKPITPTEQRENLPKRRAKAKAKPAVEKGGDEGTAEASTSKRKRKAKD